MYLNKISIDYSDAADSGKQEYEFSKKGTLITSRGRNTKGKTSLIRFILWGMGFDVALTSHFHYQNANTEIFLEREDETLKLTRKANILELESANGVERFKLSDNENELLRSVFKKVSGKLLDQILGFFYFDQDGGYKAWNRNYVTQRLSNDRSYKISIESLLAEFEGADYQYYLDQQAAYNKAKSKTKGLQSFLESALVERQTSVSQNVEERITILNDEIAKRQLELENIQSRIQTYSRNLKDFNNLRDLVKKLSLDILINGKVYNVNESNLVENKNLKIRLTETVKYYDSRKKQLSKEIDDLQSDRLELMPQNEVEHDSFFNVPNDYFDLINAVSHSGITISSVETAYDEINQKQKSSKDEFMNMVKKGRAYDEIWNNIVDFASITGLSDQINIHKNRLLDDRLGESGAQRALTVMVYRLGVLKFIQDKYDFTLPLILDSPASSEMDENNLSLVLSAVKTMLPDNQLIVATNQNSDFAFDKEISIERGVLQTLVDEG
ncbi:hypothetical protein GPK34_03575 [Secundilactobacillus kimchicus]|uniref:hypothetical protein n=1 Tax=Secundilactobacillus kimchicus TaxID=528209 RepID=UPI001C0202A1|nr:hypothetical protein [Secundilactobacillus kimchicus]MBT9671109.1 hypothetical protein [Secundilactobacillus kimchicus]